MARRKKSPESKARRQQSSEVGIYQVPDEASILELRRRQGSTPLDQDPDVPSPAEIEAVQKGISTDRNVDEEPIPSAAQRKRTPRRKRTAS